jgi:hypothetical protein
MLVGLTSLQKCVEIHHSSLQMYPVSVLGYQWCVITVEIISISTALSITVQSIKCSGRTYRCLNTLPRPSIKSDIPAPVARLTFHECCISPTVPGCSSGSNTRSCLLSRTSVLVVISGFTEGGSPPSRIASGNESTQSDTSAS